MKFLPRIRQVLGRYKDASLVKKMLFGYLILILIPCLLFIVALSRQYLTQQCDRFLADEQRAMQQEHGNFMNRISQIEGYHVLFQNEKTVLQYLGGQYQNAAEELFYYTADIKPVFSYLLSSDTNVAQASVYTLRKPHVSLPVHLLYRPETAAILPAMPTYGLWDTAYDEAAGLTMTFRVPIFTSDFYKRIGYVELSLTPNVVPSYLYAPNSIGHRFIQIDDAWYLITSSSLVPVEASGEAADLLATFLSAPEQLRDSNSFRYQRLLANRIQFSNLNAEVVSLTAQNRLPGLGAFRTQLLLLITLFLLLSLLYFLVISSFTTRLRKFSHYIAKTDYNFLAAYEVPTARDEVGQVITAYNQMVTRIRDLLSDLNIAELKKNEANYFALQAQMQPHFLYNTLETARMMAESNNDEEVADFLVNIGTVIRYSFTSVERDVTLQTELDIVGKYLAIYKTSLGPALAYRITAEEDFSAVRCPPFLLQPLVENSIKHGTRPGRAPLHIHINARWVKGQLALTVSDDGQGIDEKALTIIHQVLAGNADPADIPQRGSGLGLRSIITRLASFYGSAACFRVESTPNHGTTCCITIPQEEESLL